MWRETVRASASPRPLPIAPSGKAIRPSRERRFDIGLGVGTTATESGSRYSLNELLRLLGAVGLATGGQGVGNFCQGPKGRSSHR